MNKIYCSKDCTFTDKYSYNILFYTDFKTKKFSRLNNNEKYSNLQANVNLKHSIELLKVKIHAERINLDLQ